MYEQGKRVLLQVLGALFIIKVDFHEAIKAINYFGTQASFTPWASALYKPDYTFVLWGRQGTIFKGEVGMDDLHELAYSQMDSF